MEILIYVLNYSCKFGGCNTHLGDLWQFLGASLCENTVKTTQNLKNIPKHDKNNLTNTFVENRHIDFKQQKVSLVYVRPISESSDVFWVVSRM